MKLFVVRSSHFFRRSCLCLGLVAIFKQSLADAPTIAIPPKDLQTGGANFFSQLRPATQTHPQLKETTDAIFFNQVVDLDRLAIGTNIIFVTSRGGTFGWAISNGRFDDTHEMGSLRDGSYPRELADHRNSETNDKFLLGKYIWPQDADGTYLPGEKLIRSNGPHRLIAKLLRQSHAFTGGEDNFLGGHILIGNDGKAVVGYVSGLNDQGYFHGLEDVRVLPAADRARLHAAMGKAFKGRDVQSVLASAPIKPAKGFPNEDIVAAKAEEFYPEANRFQTPKFLFPPELAFLNEEQLIKRFETSTQTGDISFYEHLHSYGLAALKTHPQAAAVFEENFAQAILNFQVGRAANSNSLRSLAQSTQLLDALPRLKFALVQVAAKNGDLQLLEPLGAQFFKANPQITSELFHLAGEAGQVGLLEKVSSWIWSNQEMVDPNLKASFELALSRAISSTLHKGGRDFQLFPVVKNPKIFAHAPNAAWALLRTDEISPDILVELALNQSESLQSPDLQKKLFATLQQALANSKNDESMGEMLNLYKRSAPLLGHHPELRDALDERLGRALRRAADRSDYYEFSLLVKDGLPYVLANENLSHLLVKILHEKKGTDFLKFIHKDEIEARKNIVASITKLSPSASTICMGILLKI